MTPELSEPQSRIGGRRLRVVLIKVLSWLKYRARAKLPWQPLTLMPDHEWVRDLRFVIEASKTSAELFSLIDGKLDINVSVEETERNSAVHFVDELFNPPLMRETASKNVPDSPPSTPGN